MKRSHWASALLVAWILASSEGVVRAQPPGLMRPSISPWMGLFQRNPGPLGNYNSYVRPQLDLQNTFRQQQAAIQRQGASISALGQTLSEMEGIGGVRPTGTGSVFMDLSHYYPQSSRAGAAARPRATAPRPAARSSRRPSMPSISRF